MTYTNFVGLANGSAWPYWTQGGQSDYVMDVQSNQGRLRATSFAHAWPRRISPPLNTDLTVKFNYTIPSTSVLTLGLRCENYVLGFGPRYGYFWKIRNGQTGGVPNQLVRGNNVSGSKVETVLETGPQITVTGGQSYLAHFRVRTLDAATVQLRTKLWMASDPEPDWQMTYLDTSASRLVTNPAAFIILQQSQYLNSSEVRFDATELTDNNLYVAPAFGAFDMETAGVHRVELIMPSSSSWSIERQAWTGRGRPR